MHNIDYRTYPENCNKAAVQKNLDQFAAHEGYQEGCSGLSHPIRWIDTICDSYDEAVEYVKAHDRGWYDQLAVKYRELPFNLPRSKTYAAKLQRRNELQKKLREEMSRVHYSPQTVKSAFLGCKSCGSKLNIQFLKGNYCPVCRKDLRPKTVLDNIQRLQSRLSEINAEIDSDDKVFAKKQSDKAVIKWLVKIEWHT